MAQDKWIKEMQDRIAGGEHFCRFETNEQGEIKCSCGKQMWVTGIQVGVSK